MSAVLDAFAIKCGVTYQFMAFPMTYWPSDRRRENQGYRGGCLSTFTYDTLAEAQKEVKHLRRIYKKTRNDVVKRHAEARLLVIFRVEKTEVQR